MLLIISAYYANSTMFYHRHIVGNKTIFHSHFFTDNHTDSSDDGGHTSSQIEIIEHLNSISIEEQYFDCNIKAIERPLEYTSLITLSERLASYWGSHKSLRAPPVV